MHKARYSLLSPISINKIRESDQMCFNWVSKERSADRDGGMDIQWEGI